MSLCRRVIVTELYEVSQMKNEQGIMLFKINWTESKRNNFFSCYHLPLGYTSKLLILPFIFQWWNEGMCHFPAHRFNERFELFDSEHFKRKFYSFFGFFFFFPFFKTALLFRYNNYKVLTKRWQNFCECRRNSCTVLWHYALTERDIILINILIQ